MLTVRGLCKNYGDLPVLDCVDLQVGAGEIVALLGPSGCGKTTLLNIVAGLDRADAGRVDPGGARVGYVFQEDRLLPWRTVTENIALVGDGSEPEAVEELVRLVGLDGFAASYPGMLSGGMRQRCAIARAYHYRCDLLLMDEPFKSLDHALRLEMGAVLLRLWRERGNAVLLVTHDVDEALALAGRVVVLAKRPTRVVREFAPGRADGSKRAAIKREIIGLIS